MKVDPMPLCSFLWSDDSEHVLSLQQQEVNELFETTGKDKDINTDNKWLAEHIEVFRDAGLQNPPDWNTVQPLKNALDLAGLCRRQKEFVYFCEYKHPEVKDWCVDINMSMDFILAKEITEGCCACLAGSTLLWHVPKRRLVAAPEALSIQGFPFSL